MLLLILYLQPLSVEKFHGLLGSCQGYNKMEALLSLHYSNVHGKTQGLVIRQSIHQMLTSKQLSDWQIIIILDNRNSWSNIERLHLKLYPEEILAQDSCKQAGRIRFSAPKYEILPTRNLTPPIQGVILILAQWSVLFIQTQLWIPSRPELSWAPSVYPDTRFQGSNGCKQGESASATSLSTVVGDLRLVWMGC